MDFRNDEDDEDFTPLKYDESEDEDYDGNTYNVNSSNAYLDNKVELKSVKQAMKDKRWVEAMDKEISSLKKNDTYVLSLLPKNAKAVTVKWVYKIKRTSTGSIEKFKAWIVARGYSQILGQNYWETFTPVTRGETLKLLIGLYTLLMDRAEIVLDHWDAASAFLQGKIDTDIYLEPAPGYEEYDAEGNKYYWYLKKSLYGLKQAGRIWNDTLTKALLETGFKQSKIDLCLFYYFREEEWIIIAVHVDDMTTLSNSVKLCDELLSPLKKKIALEHLGPAKWLLKTEIVRDHENHRVSITQKQYIKEMLERFNLKHAKSVDTPSRNR
jgi:hypothetical protein